MHTPSVTVLMPVYNGAQYLSESIDTILAQTHREFEFLIINDGSTDESASIIDAYAARDARIRVIHQANMGLAATLNHGLGLSAGEFVARQDQDDLSSSDRLRLQLEFMQAHPDCGLLGTRASIMVDRTPTERAHDHPSLNSVLKLDLLFNNPFVHSSVMLRRRTVLGIGGYTTDRARQPPEDYELWSRMARAGRVANLPERLLVYREAARSMSRTGVNPFHEKLLLLCAENLAFAAGLTAPDQACHDIAALVHGAPERLSAKPHRQRMQEILQLGFARIRPEVQSDKEREEFDARCRYWSANVQHHYLRHVVQPKWAEPFTTVLLRQARRVMRKLASLSRGV